ncbi:unnamed protein product [Parascedosporium putredinis]|uniref:Nitrogen regulatory protein areA GATA-like domain-containing protein n=1 Tax=Parascedosporium putredinis TaxID=1442378 RepID=A0A9P1HB56_9PEZI|nr:unnamed protein product [Parascedosporium putredinis]CAI8004647.1 unnamed protein product [Parascedosporium putredinis]
MPFQLDTPVLTVDTGIIHKVDAGNPQTLYDMWTVFSRCGDSVQNGRRLEYMCWRYWNRATMLNSRPEPISGMSQSAPQAIPSVSSMQEMPQLSKSVDSAPDEEAVDFTAETSPVDIRPRISRQDSCGSRRDRTPRSEEFEKLFVSIIKEQEPLLPQPPARQAVAAPLQRSGSTTEEESTQSSQTSEDVISEASQQTSPDLSYRTTTVIRGFSPQPALLFSSAAEAGERHLHLRCIQLFERPPEPPYSQDLGQAQAARFPDWNVGFLGRRGLLRSAMQKSRSGTFLGQKKQVTIQQMRAHESSAIEDDDTECDDVDESAIDDDEDDSDWEDSDEASGKSSIDDKTYFKRVDSSAQLVSRRSLITLGLEATERQRRLGNPASQSTSALHRPRGALAGQQVAGSPNDSDESSLMMKRGGRVSQLSQLKPINENPRTGPQPIMAPPTQNHFPAALSPRTTRRHMLATELTPSLRRNLLWERQQKSSTANAVLKRRHTSHDVANLKQYPERAYTTKAEDANSSSWNQYFSKEAFNGYHSKGW